LLLKGIASAKQDCQEHGQSSGMELEGYHLVCICWIWILFSSCGYLLDLVANYYDRFGTVIAELLAVDVMGRVFAQLLVLPVSAAKL
jgi:hypothetical protein